MTAVVQRIRCGRVSVGGEEVGRAGQGLLSCSVWRQTTNGGMPNCWQPRF